MRLVRADARSRIGVPPKAVQFAFSGNNPTAWMKGYELSTKAYNDKYRADTLTAISIFASGSTHVYLIGAPITKQQQSVPNRQHLLVIADPRILI